MRVEVEVEVEESYTFQPLMGFWSGCNAPLGKKYASYVNEFHFKGNAIVLSVHQSLY